MHFTSGYPNWDYPKIGLISKGIKLTIKNGWGILMSGHGTIDIIFPALYNADKPCPL